MFVNNKLVTVGIGAIPDAPGTPEANDRTRKMSEWISETMPAAKNLSVYQTGPRRYQINFNAASEIEAEGAEPAGIRRDCWWLEAHAGFQWELP